MGLQDAFYLSAIIFNILAFIFILWLLVIVFLVVRKVSQVQKEIERKANLVNLLTIVPAAGVVKATSKLVDLISEKLHETNKN